MLSCPVISQLQILLVLVHRIHHPRTLSMRSTLAELGGSQPLSVCSFDYLSRDKLYDDEKPYYFSGPLSKDQEKARSNLAYTTHDGIKLRDIRGFEHSLSLDIHGFRMLKYKPQVSLVDPDDQQIHGYLTETSNFLKEVLDAEAVITYNYRVRDTPWSFLW